MRRNFKKARADRFSQSDGRIVVDAKSYREFQEHGSTDFMAPSVAAYLESFNPKPKGDSETDDLLPPADEPEMSRSDSNESLDKLLARLRPRDSSRPSKAIVKTFTEPVELKDEDYLICPAKIQAFLLDHKVWVEALVSQLEPVKWYPDSFHFLELDKEKKRLVKALVESFDTDDPFEGFDDVVQGKGKGLIFLLHGPPGLGKTLTAGKMGKNQRNLMG